MNNYKARVINFLRILAWILPLVMLPISIYVIPYIDEKKWRTESTGIVFDNMDLVNDNSFLGYGNKFAGLHRDTILFNRSNISKSISIPSVLSVERQKSQILQVDNKYHQISSLGVKKVKSLDKE